MKAPMTNKNTETRHTAYVKTNCTSAKVRGWLTCNSIKYITL